MGQELGIPKPRKETGQAMWMIDYFDGTDMTDLPRWLEDMLPPNPETGVKDPRIGMLSDILTHPDLKLPQLLQKVQSIINLLANEEQIIREQLFPKSGEKYTSNPEAVVSMLNRHRFHEINDLILNWLARNYIQNNHDSFFKNGSESALYVSQYENPHLIKGLAGAIELIATTTQNPMTIVSVGCGKGPIESMVDIQLSSTTKRRWLGLEPNPPAEKERGFFKGRMYPLDTDSPLSYIEMLQKENIHIDPRHTVVFLFSIEFLSERQAVDTPRPYNSVLNSFYSDYYLRRSRVLIKAL